MEKKKPKIKRSEDKAKVFYKTCRNCYKSLKITHYDKKYKEFQSLKCPSCGYDDFPMLTPMGKLIKIETSF